MPEPEWTYRLCSFSFLPSKGFGCLCSWPVPMGTAVTGVWLLSNKLCDSCVEPCQGFPPWSNLEWCLGATFKLRPFVLSCVAEMPVPWLSDLDSWLDFRPALPLWTCLAIAGLMLTLVRVTGPALLSCWGAVGLHACWWGHCPAHPAVTLGPLQSCPLLLLWHPAAGKAMSQICRASLACTNKTFTPSRTAMHFWNTPERLNAWFGILITFL